MLVSITAALVNMAQQYKQLGLTFTVAGTTFFQDPDVIKDPAAEGFVHTQIRIEAPPELAAEFKSKFDAEMEFFVRQYDNASQILMTAMDKLLADGKPITGENMRDCDLQDSSLPGPDPAGIQDQYGDRSAGHQCDARRQGCDDQDDECRLIDACPAASVQWSRDGLRAWRGGGHVFAGLFHDQTVPCRPCRGFHSRRLPRMVAVGRGVPFIVAFMVAVVVSAGALGALIQTLLYARLERRHATHLVILIASLGTLAVMQNIIAAVYSPNILQFSLPWSSAVVGRRRRIRLTVIQVLIVAASVTRLWRLDVVRASHDPGQANARRRVQSVPGGDHPAAAAPMCMFT